MKSRNGYNQAVVVAFLKEYGVPEPEFEFRFDPTRRWRWDMAWINPAGWGRGSEMLALECNGGNWVGGAHVRPARMLQEYAKWNKGVCLGWKILLVTPQQLLTKQTVDMVRECLGLCPVPDKHIGMAAKL